MMPPADIAAIDPAYWSNLYEIKLGGVKFSFKDREYQIGPMQSTAKRKCCMKATQLGFSTMAMLSTLHGLIYGKYPQGALYLFPTTDNMQEFSKAKFGPLLTANKEVIGRWVKTGGKGTDTASLKKIHDAFLYLRGARLSQKIGEGESDKGSVQLVGISVDHVDYDEVDYMDEDAIAKAKGRMGNSTIASENFLGNPSAPDRGIAKLYQLSDQRHWFRRCSCGEWVCAELTFPECVKVRQDGTGFIGCPKCGKDVGPSARVAKQEWVPAKPENTAYMEGVQLSQLSSIVHDPAEILDHFNEPPQGNIGDVYRLELGLPYVAAEDQLTSKVVLDCCGQNVMPTSHIGPCAMGVDVGKIMHVVIGIRTAADRYEILKVIRLSNFEDIHDIANRFHVKSAVVDIRPYEDSARKFQKSEPYRIFLCEYSENTTLGVTYNDHTGIVKANRTEIFDTTHRLISSMNIRIPRECPEVKEFAQQCCATAKILETNKKTGTSIYRYRKSGDEHYRNALNYFILAASGARLARSGGSQNRSKIAKNDYALV
jgi:hypothetical protein